MKSIWKANENGRSRQRSIIEVFTAKFPEQVYFADCQRATFESSPMYATKNMFETYLSVERNERILLKWRIGKQLVTDVQTWYVWNLSICGKKERNERSVLRWRIGKQLVTVIQTW